MYTKVMICDDELLSRNRLRSMLDWEKHGYYICAEAENGEQAIRLLAEARPQIVLTDIDMPIMDGVSLCRHLYEHHGEMKLIVLSNYDDYDYVRDTMQSGAVDYLLKHRLNAERLLEVLGKTSERLAGVVPQAGGSIGTHPQSAAETLRRCIERDEFGGTAESDIPEPLRPFAGNSCAVAVQLLQEVQVQEERPPVSEADRNGILLQSVGALLQQIVGNGRAGVALHRGNGLFLVLLAYPEYRSEAPILQSVQAYTEKLKRTIGIVYGLGAEIGCSPVCHRFHQLGSHIASAERELSARLRGGADGPPASAFSSSGPGSAGFAGPRKTDNEDAGLTIKQEKELLNALSAGNAPGIRDILREAFDSFAPATSTYAQRLLFVEEAINFAHRVGRKSKADVGWISEATRIDRPPIGRWEEMNAWVTGVYIRLAGEIYEAQAGPAYSRHVALAMKLIRAKYYEALSLEEAAAAAGITASYLSKLFKEETGKSFTETVNHYRIELGKQYIEHGQASIKEICAMLGFHNYPYFFKVFKDIVGETPQAYARRVGGKIRE